MLLTSQKTKQSQAIQQTAPELGSAEALKQILTVQQGHEVALGDAEEIAGSLIELYQILAEEVSDDTNC